MHEGQKTPNAKRKMTLDMIKPLLVCHALSKTKNHVHLFFRYMVILGIISEGDNKKNFTIKKEVLHLVAL